MNESRLRIVVLMGGPDAERAVSLQSGASIAAALRESDRVDVIEEIIETPSVDELHAMHADVFFPALHGPWGEGGPLQLLLEDTSVPYVGSGPEAAATAMDKWKTKRLLHERFDDFVSPAAQIVDKNAPCLLEPPLVLKPVDDGSSVDTRICRTEQEVRAAQNELLQSRDRILAEQFIDGRELTVGILRDEPLPIIEIVPGVPFYDYDAKYDRDDTQYLVDPDLPAGVAERCNELAMQAYRALGCRDLARADFMLDKRGPWFLEINTMPGFTSHSLLPMAAKHAGIPMPQLCAQLIEAAVARSDSQTVRVV